jgi:hypothetical protein
LRLLTLSIGGGGNKEGNPSVPGDASSCAASIGHPRRQAIHHDGIHTEPGWAAACSALGRAGEHAMQNIRSNDRASRIGRVVGTVVAFGVIAVIAIDIVSAVASLAGA